MIGWCTTSRLALAVEIASIAEGMRGYGHTHGLNKLRL